MVSIAGCTGAGAGRGLGDGSGDVSGAGDEAGFSGGGGVGVTCCVRGRITIDEERINRSYGASPSATSRHVNCAPYFRLRLSSNRILLILVSKFQTPQHSFFRLGLL